MTSTTAEPGFEYLSDPDPLLICNICNEAFIDPVLTPCSHTFCRACVTRWMTDKPTGGCPKCRKRLVLSDETLRTDLRLREQLDDLMVECVDPRCTWEGRRGDHARHKVNDCPVRSDGTQNRRSTNTDLMTIFIKTFEGRSMTFEVKPTETVERLKQLVEERQLEDGQTLKYYNIRHNATGHLADRVRGG